MFGLGKRDGDGGEAAPVTLAGDFEASVSFEDGKMVLAGPGFRLKLDKESALMLANRAAVAQRFTEIESPAHGVFDDAAMRKTCSIMRFLRHGLSLEEAARVLGEKASSVRAFYGWALDQALFRSSSASDDEKARLMELDRVRAVAQVPGGVIRNNGVLVSASTGVPVRETFTTINGIGVARMLRAHNGNTKDAARELRVDPDDLGRWVEANGEMLAVLK